MNLLNQRLDFTINRYTLDELPFIEYPYRSTYILRDAIQVNNIHNLLEGLQGGTSNEYYHLTLSEYENLQNLNNLYYPLNSNPANYITIGDIPALEAGIGLSINGDGNIQLGNLNTSNTIKISLTDKVNTEGTAIFQTENIIGDNLSNYSDFTLLDQNIPNRFWESYREISASAWNSQTKEFNKSASLTIQAQTAINNGALSLANIGAGGVSLEFYSYRNGNTNVDDTYARFRDFTNERGVEYAGDYELNFVPRSLVTKQWVEGLGYTTPQDLESVVNIGNTASRDIFIQGVRFGVGGGNSIENVAIGLNSLKSNTTGIANIAIGPAALEFNTTGIWNVAIGYLAMISNNVGNYNVALGGRALAGINNSSNNIAIGDGAAHNLPNQVAMASAQDSIFIGANSKSPSNGQVNQIVIGTSLVGAGSNTVSLGNSSVVSTFLRGTVTITDSVNLKGAQNGGDYEPNFTARSLVTKQYTDSLFNSLTANNGVQRVGNVFSVDATVIRTSGEQIKTGLLRYRFGSIGESLVASYEYPDNSGEDYNFRLYSNAISNNVGYYWRQKFSLAINGGAETGVLDYPMIGFKNGILSIGSETYPLGTLGIETYYNAQTAPVVRNPLLLYVTGQSIFTGRIYTGKSDFINTLFLTSANTLYNEGTLYSKDGLRTKDAELQDTVLDASTWLLGEAKTTVGALTATHDIFVRIDGVLYRILAQEIV